ncbi:MAG: hypothetical protein K0R17_267 [Rariglobus sp.]|jgi:hypothetical protein|nr:hypothetical protein [Rariglobus sp.]
MGVMALAAISPLTAQPVPPPPVEVTNVKFNAARVDSGTWYVTEIEVQGRPGAATDNRNFINRVKVSLNLGIFSVKAPQGAKIPDTYYRASAEAVAVDSAGGKAVFRFYLPPEIVKRDQITGDQKFYLIELFVDGKALPLTKNHFTATALSKPEFVESFRSKVSSEAGVNDGIMLPQYLTPFAFAGSPPPPSFIRIESTR